jgi:hypothetical protein
MRMKRIPSNTAKKQIDQTLPPKEQKYRFNIEEEKQRRRCSIEL